MGEDVSTNDEVIGASVIVENVTLDHVEATACAELREGDGPQSHHVGLAVDASGGAEETLFCAVVLSPVWNRTCLDESDTAASVKERNQLES